MTTIPMIASIGLSDKEQATLQAVISVAVGLEIGSWQLAEHSQSITAVFVNLDTPSAKDWLADIQRQGSATLLVMCTAQKQLDAPYAYQIPSPLNYRSVVLLFKELEAQLNRTKNPEQEELITAEGLQKILRRYPYQAPEMLTVEVSEPVQLESLDVGNDFEGVVAELPSSSGEISDVGSKDSASSVVSSGTELDVDNSFEGRGENPLLTSEVNEDLLGDELEEIDSTAPVSPDLESEVENCFEDQVNNSLGSAEGDNVHLSIELEGSESIPPISSDAESEVEHYFEDLADESKPKLEDLELSNSEVEVAVAVAEATVVPLQMVSDESDSDLEEAGVLNSGVEASVGESAADKKAPLKKSYTYLPQRSLFDVPIKTKNNKSADDLLQMLNRPAMRFYRYTRLLGLVHSIVEQNQAAVVTHPSLPAIVISPESGVFGTIEPLDHEPELFTTAAYKFQVQEISSADLGDVMVGCIVQPLWALFYSAALFGSEGRLMEAFAPCDVLRLKRAPDFKRVPHCQEHIKLSKYLVSHNVDMVALAQITEISLPVVIDFCNACEEAGLIKRLPAVNQGFDGGSNGFTRQAKVAGFPASGEHKKTKFKHRIRSSFCREKDGASLRAANDSR